MGKAFRDVLRGDKAFRDVQTGDRGQHQYIPFIPPPHVVPSIHPTEPPISPIPQVDHVSFVTQFLPHFLTAHYPWLGETHKETLLSPWRAGAHLDAPTFSSFLEDLVSDIGFFRAQLEAE